MAKNAPRSVSSRLFLLAHARKAAQVGQADLDRGLLHRPLGRPAGGAERARDRLALVVEHGDPVGDEAAFAGLGAVQLAGQRRLAAAAHAVAHHDDLAHLEHLHSELERRRDAVIARIGLERRDQRGDVRTTKTSPGRTSKICAGRHGCPSRR
jgi:hypothetical protein